MLVPYNFQAIQVVLSDKVIDSTTIKRKAQFDDMLYSHSQQKVTVFVTVFPFAKLAGGGYGQSLTGTTNMKPEQKTFVADNSSIVNAATGGLIGKVTDYTLNDPATFAPGGPLAGLNVMREFDFYAKIANESPVVINNLILAKIAEADAQGRL